ncbi:MAG TPA: serine hydrolase, partial [Planctomycetota bacterium]|nr:serine hydrolase [Planctomycetota bacterium]
QAVLNHIWDKLLPAMGTDALAANADATKALTTKLAGLSMRLPEGKQTSPIAATVAGAWYAVPDNERGITALALDTKSQPTALLVRTAAGETRTPVPFGAWSAPTPGFTNNLDHSLSVPANPTVSASGAWTADDTFTVKLVLNQTTFYSTLNLKFEGQKLTVSSKHNVNFGSTAMPELIGQAAAGR